MWHEVGTIMLSYVIYSKQGVLPWWSMMLNIPSFRTDVALRTTHVFIIIYFQLIIL